MALAPSIELLATVQRVGWHFSVDVVRLLVH